MKKVDKLKKNCLICGKEMLLVPSIYKTKKYCCKNCKDIALSIKNIDKNNDDFYNKVEEIYNDKITIISEYNGNKKNIKFRCNICETTDEIRADKLLSGRSCKVCSSYSYTKESFINKINEVYNNEYKLIGEFINMGNPTYVLHKKCGSIIQINPTKFITMGENSCKICNNTKSNGEIEIENILNKSNIKYEKQKKFEDLILYRQLSYDFYLNDYNLCVEFNGSQHYKPIETFGGENSFGKQVMRDAIKQAYCEDNKIDLLIIPFWEYRNIEKILESKLNLKERCINV